MRTVLLVALFLFCEFAKAESIGKTKTIDLVVVYKTYAVIKFTPAASGSELVSCPGNKADYAVLEFENNEQQYSALLSAYVSKNSHVGFGVSGCRQGTGNNHPLIYRVDLGS